MNPHRGILVAPQHFPRRHVARQRLREDLRRDRVERVSGRDGGHQRIQRDDPALRRRGERAGVNLVRAGEADAVFGDTDHVIDEISGMIEELGYEGLHMILYASLPGMTSEEVKTQMTAFADELVPYLEGEYPSP